MIRHQGVWLPDGETHLTAWMTSSGELVDGVGTYQIKKLRAAVSYCKQHRVAVDVGAHVGMWTMQLARQFETIHAFEPVAAHRECFAMNLHINGSNILRPGVHLHPCALGEEHGFVTMATAPTSSGDTRVESHSGDIPMKLLDDFQLLEVDFVKLDCEGYELHALRGGEQTILRNKPVIIVEQKPGRGQRFGFEETEAVSYLEKLGYKCVRIMSGDFIMVPV